LEQVEGKRPLVVHASNHNFGERVVARTILGTIGCDVMNYLDKSLTVKAKGIQIIELNGAHSPIV
jgi:hypothetical protein